MYINFYRNNNNNDNNYVKDGGRPCRQVCTDISFRSRLAVPCSSACCRHPCTWCVLCKQTTHIKSHKTTQLKSFSRYISDQNIESIKKCVCFKSKRHIKRKDRRRQTETKSTNFWEIKACIERHKKTKTKSAVNYGQCTDARLQKTLHINSSVQGMMLYVTVLKLGSQKSYTIITPIRFWGISISRFPVHTLHFVQVPPFSEIFLETVLTCIVKPRLLQHKCRLSVILRSRAECYRDVTYVASGSYSAQTRMYSSRWCGPKMEESRVK